MTEGDRGLPGEAASESYTSGHEGQQCANYPPNLKPTDTSVDPQFASTPSNFSTGPWCMHCSHLYSPQWAASQHLSSLRELQCHPTGQTSASAREARSAHSPGERALGQTGPKHPNPSPTPSVTEQQPPRGPQYAASLGFTDSQLAVR